MPMTTALHATTVATPATRIVGDAQLPLAVLAADVDGRMMCVVIDSFFDESLAPGLISVRIPADDPAWQRLRTAPTLGVSVLHSVHTRTGGTSADDKLSGTLRRDTLGAVFVEGAAAEMNTRLYQEFDAGTHTVALLHISSRTTRGPLKPHGSVHYLAA